MLLQLSSLGPSQPLRLFVNTTGVPGVPCFPPVVGILTIQSIAVLHTNMASPALLNSTPLAPKGGRLRVAYHCLAKGWDRDLKPEHRLRRSRDIHLLLYATVRVE